MSYLIIFSLHLSVLIHFLSLPYFTYFFRLSHHFSLIHHQSSLSYQNHIFLSCLTISFLTTSPHYLTISFHLASPHLLSHHLCHSSLLLYQPLSYFIPYIAISFLSHHICPSYLIIPFTIIPYLIIFKQSRHK